jgi:hypothetical protein
MPLTPESLKEDIQEIKRQLGQILRDINSIAVHNERLRNIEQNIEALWKRHDQKAEPLDKIANYQASCPREEVRWIKWIIIPQSATLIAMAYKIFITGGP